MVSFEHIHHLMSEIGPILELDAVNEFEEDQSWALFVDDDIAITVDSDFELGKLVFSTELASVPESLAAHQRLLTFNSQWASTGGLRLGLDEPGGVAILIVDLPVHGLELEKLELILRNFVEQAQVWRRIIEAGVEQDDRDEPPSDTDTSMGIRV